MAFLLRAMLNDITSPSLLTPSTTLVAVVVVAELSSLLLLVVEVCVQLSLYQSSSVEQAATAKSSVAMIQK